MLDRRPRQVPTKAVDIILEIEVDLAVRQEVAHPESNEYVNEVNPINLNTIYRTS